MDRAVAIIGLRISALQGDPQRTLLGNPVRSWALFTHLPRYGFSTKLFVDANARIDLEILDKYGSRLIRRPEEFLQRASTGNFAAIIVCGTRIQLSLEHHPWLAGMKPNCPVFLAQCYHNIDDPLPDPLRASIAGATFVTPKFQHRWLRAHPHTQTGLITTGQIARSANASESNGDAVFVGHIHTHAIIKKLMGVAAKDRTRAFHIVSSRTRTPGGPPGDYIAFGPMSGDEERQAKFAQILAQIGAVRPENVFFHYLPPGQEEELLDRVSIGLDFSWNPRWEIDNSKVPYYLSFGLNVISQLPAPSYRFVQRFDAGFVLPYEADERAWLEKIAVAGDLSVDRKNELRAAAGAYFSWANTAFDLASVMQAHFDQAS